MARILVQAADIADGRIARLKVRLDGLPDRVIDRDTAVAWLRDGHSLLPSAGGSLGLFEFDGEDGLPAYSIRHDGGSEAVDALPSLPAV